MYVFMSVASAFWPAYAVQLEALTETSVSSSTNSTSAKLNETPSGIQLYEIAIGVLYAIVINSIAMADAVERRESYQNVGSL